MGEGEGEGKGVVGKDESRISRFLLSAGERVRSRRDTCNITQFT